ncbi:uncharacterized protein LOC114298836 [Camellia sinensis]|uniref:uncharacterized protein LOC114298836 n=1 Tax=Camellia sinensis TaxID=4442 RepID=UPI001036A0AE|nr:uncharacterized protein LOC114298836 [Camellia sinensis]
MGIVIDALLVFVYIDFLKNEYLHANEQSIFGKVFKNNWAFVLNSNTNSTGRIWQLVETASQASKIPSVLRKYEPDPSHVLDWVDLEASLDDISYSGCQFTWANNQFDGHYIVSKIDRVLGNDQWFKTFPFSHVRFCPAGISDHSLTVLFVVPIGVSYRKPFKYFKFYVDHKEFIPIAQSVWWKYVQGSPMFRTCCKMRSLKPLLKGLNKRDFSDLSSRVQCARSELENARIKLDKDPLNLEFQVNERNLCKKYVDLCNAEESLAHQKSRVQWLSLGDRNSAFFFRSIRNNQNRSSNSGVTLDNGVRLTKPPDIHNAFVANFSNLFGSPHADDYNGFERVNSLVNKRLTYAQMVFIARDVTVDEIKDVFKSFIPTRPLALMGSLLVSSIVLRRLWALKSLLPLSRSLTLSAFVQGRRIADNIFLSQELMRGYYKESLSPTCAMKVDLMKAYDNVSLHGHFQGARGLRQGHVPSVQLIKTGLMEFQSLSGLALNPQKSHVFFSGCDASLRNDILRITQFQEGHLPVKYLGVPLIPIRLKAIDCQSLVTRITVRIKSSTNKTLSYAGRAQLISTIIFSMQVYWSSLFILPKRVIKEVEALCRSFLWSDLGLKNTGAKVAWDRVCAPKNGGGLGFESMTIWNKAVVAKHAWFLISCGEQSMWCQRVKSCLLRGHSFWEVNVPCDPSWSKVAFVVKDSGWCWPNASSWVVKEILTHTPPDLTPSMGSNDKIVWLPQKDGKFSIGCNMWKLFFEGCEVTIRGLSDVTLISGGVSIVLSPLRLQIVRGSPGPGCIAALV